MLSLKCIFLLWVVKTAFAKMEGFIVGGKFANIEQHAHSAFLSVMCVQNDGSREDFVCGSSIINQELLLTAAHCLYGCTYESIIRINIGSEIQTHGIAISAKSFIIHQAYNVMTSGNDISMFSLTRKLTLGKKITRVAIMKNPPYTEGAIVAGWGMTDEIRQTFTDRLKFTSQKVWSRNSCLQLFQSLPKDTICAANDNKGDYASLGDSGSALVVRGYIQIGLVSYKIPSVSRQVVIYTDVGYHYNWIRSSAKKLACL